MSKKAQRLLIVYTLAALGALGALSFAAENRLAFYRREADITASRAFEEAVDAARSLSLGLAKLAYVTDDVLGRSLCAGAAADAGRAETAISVLPFSTQELEQTQGRLNRAGDYAMSLVAKAGEALDETERERLRALGKEAADFADLLAQLQGALHDGSLALDRRERPLQNTGADETPKLSSRLLDYEAGLDAPTAFVYEGQFSPRESPAPGTLSPEQGRALAARALGVEERELLEETAVEGPDGRRSFSARGTLVGVSSRGLEFLAQPRLIEEAVIPLEEARTRAAAFLERVGCEGLSLCAESEDGPVARFSFAPTVDGAPCVDDAVLVAVALDDGSVCAVDATKLREEDGASLAWSVGEEEARDTLPPGLEVETVRKVVRRSPGGRSMACWELGCTGAEGEALRFYVDAADGRQWDIELIRAGS